VPEHGLPAVLRGAFQLPLDGVRPQRGSNEGGGQQCAGDPERADESIDTPRLGLDLNEEYLKANLVPGEAWWG